MRHMLLATALVCGAALSAPAFADDYTSHAGSPHTPTSSMATNLGAGDTHSTISPKLPASGIPDSAGPEAYLSAAKMDLKMKKTGAAQEALEQAETRYLTRSTAADDASTPDGGPMVGQIRMALDALGHHDVKGATMAIDKAMMMTKG